MKSWKKAYHANCWGPLGGNAVGVTSISQLSYCTFGDMRVAATEIAKAGYTGIELFDGNLSDYSLLEWKALLADLDLSLVAVYSGANFIFDEIVEEELHLIRQAARDAAELGAEHLVVGGGAKRAAGPQPGDIDKLSDQLNAVVRIAEEYDLRAHYHPHLTTLVEGPEEVRKILSTTTIDFCPDTAHLAAGGGDPAQMILEHAARISYVHLKGWQRDPFAFTPLDRGDLDIDPIMKALVEMQFEGWITTELDSWVDPKAGCEASMKYLTAAESRF